LFDALTRVDGISETDLALLRQTVRDAFAADMLGQALAAMRWR